MPNWAKADPGTCSSNERRAELRLATGDSDQHTKTEIRLAMRAARRRLSDLQVEVSGAAVWGRLRQFEAYHRAPAVVSYLASENEVSTDRIHADCHALNRPLFLPSAVAPEFRRWQPHASLVLGLGATAAATGAHLGPQDDAIFLVPLVAWNTRGARLGRGSAFYDRALAQTRSDGTLIIGLGYEFQICRDLPEDPWDVLMNYIITERRVVRSVRSALS